MINLLDYIGTGSRVGRKNNIWNFRFFFYYSAGEGTFSELSPTRITFSGNTTFLGITDAFYLQVDLLSDTRCNVRFGSDNYRNVPYSTTDGTFIASLAFNMTLQLSRYNGVETEVTMDFTTPGQYFSDTWHIQPV